MTDCRYTQLRIFVCIFVVCVPVYSTRSDSFSFLAVSGCKDKLGNDDLLSLEKTKSLVACAVSCKTECLCFGFHYERKLCRRQTRCDPSRMNETEIGWLYYLPSTVCTDPYNCATWTGGNDRATEGVYVWEHSNTAIGFTNWDNINPDNYYAPNQEVDCIDMFYNGEWNDRPCAYLNGFLCERENL
ncbi:aggrecan core protein-like [Saccostrea echinata]|uniref:aggrecan core protein-like n=1 Tax=Saccostrea echinata TaxID=191078 RepID=UPI002A82C17E|nr:aggrecan core protein-like [Saccostrea echinata]